MVSLDCSKIKGVIFDIDGTVLDTMPAWDDMSSRYLRSMGVEPRADLNKIVLNMTIDEGVHYIRTAYRLSEPEEKLKDGLLDLIRQFYYEEAPFKPGARELIEGFAARGIPMVIATSGDRDLAGHALERLGVLHHFRSILTSNELNTNKEQPFIFYKAAEALFDDLADFDALPGDRALLSGIYVIEDSIYAVRTAVQAGFGTVAVEDDASRDHWQELAETAEIYVPSLAELELV